MVAQVDSKYIRSRPSKLITRLLSYLFFEGRPLTTKGQWLNPLVFAHFAIEKRLPQFKKVERPIFILGTGRSGTTILGIVLSMHKDVAFLNEPKALWHAIHPREDLIGSYDRGEASYCLYGSDAKQEMSKHANRLYGAYLTATFSSRVVDKYPELIFRVPFVEKLLPDARFLFLVRSGWDTCQSIETWSSRLGKEVNGEVHNWWGVNNRKWILLVEQVVSKHEDLAMFVKEMKGWTNHTDMAAVEWIVTMREGMRLEKSNNRNVLRVTYEKLCESPQVEIDRIRDFCKLSVDDVFNQYAQQTLRKIQTKARFDLNKNILKPFTDTMQLLGYSE